jgi:hypothetical protein
MDDLKSAVETAANALASVHAKATTALSSTTLVPSDCYRMWQHRAGLHQPLRGTLALLPAREQALAVVQSIAVDKNILDRAQSRVSFCDQSMDFAVARHLALASYLAVTWALYDRLSNVCGRLVGPECVGSNQLPTSNPKLIEHFIRDSKERHKQHGFTLSRILPQAYGWPAALCYKIRNWVVHEGIEAEGVALFRGDTIADAFELSANAMQRLEKLCDDDGIKHAQTCQSQEPNHPWYDRSMLTILARCHSEVDMMFACFVKWSTESFVGQYDAFSTRDSGSTAVAAAISGGTSP